MTAIAIIFGALFISDSLSKIAKAIERLADK